MGQRRVDVGRPHVHGHGAQIGQCFCRLGGEPSIQRRSLAVVANMQYPVFAADDRHILVPALKRGPVDADRVGKVLISARQATRHRPGDGQLVEAVLRALHPWHLSHQSGLVLAGIQMPPLAGAGVVARAAFSAVRAGQLCAGVANVDSHAGPSQVDFHFHFRDLPGRLNTENLAVELAIMHETGLESGPAGSLSEVLNPHKAGKSLDKN